MWYARPEQRSFLERHAPGLLSWTVPLDPGSDWVHEREWRVSRPPTPTPVVELTELRLAGLLVGDPSRTGARRAYRVAADTGQPRWDNFFPA